MVGYSIFSYAIVPWLKRDVYAPRYAAYRLKCVSCSLLLLPRSFSFIQGLTPSNDRQASSVAHDFHSCGRVRPSSLAYIVSLQTSRFMNVVSWACQVKAFHCGINFDALSFIFSLSSLVAPNKAKTTSHAIENSSRPKDIPNHVLRLMNCRVK